MEPISRIIWITGLSGAGTTTLATEVSRKLRSVGRPVVMLDGDEVREILGATAVLTANHGRSARIALGIKYAKLGKLISSQGVTVVIATISLFREIHAWNRENLPGYFEAYIKVPLEELRRRDPKKLYSRFEAGELSDVAGLDLPIDEPEAADWVIEYKPGRSISDLADELIHQLPGKKENEN